MKRIFLLTGLLISLNSFAQVPNYVATNGLVGYWPFTGNANDISGNGNNGTVNGAVLTVGHNAGGADAYYFANTAADCGTHYIQANINTTSINTNGAMSFSFWIYRVGDGCLGARVMEFNSCTTCPGQILVTWVNGSNIITFRHYLTATDFLTYNFSNINSNAWYHIVYTNDGTNAKYYLNGALVNTAASPDPVQLSGNVSFGRMNHASYDAFNGNLDDIGLWNRALTACEVSALYTGNPSSTFGYNALPDTTLICDSVKLDANAGYSNYTWSTGESSQTITEKQNGWYKVTVTNSGGCTASDSTYVNVIKPTVTADKNTICAGGNVMLSATGIPGASQTLVKQFNLDTDIPNTQTVQTTIGANYIMTVSGIWSVHFCTDPNNVSDAAFYYQRSPITALPDNLDLVTWNGVPVRPDGNTYNSSHIYNYTLPPATQSGQGFTFTDPGTYVDNCGALTFQIYQVQTSNATYTWSAKPAATAGLNAADVNKQSITVNPTTTTTYYVTVNDGIASCEDSVKVTVATIDTSLTVLDPPMICKNGSGSVRLHAGIANSYKWLLNNTPIPGANTVDYTATQTGNYSIVVTNSSGCIDTSRIVTVSLYPQPTAGFTINTATQCLSDNNFFFTNTSKITGAGKLQTTQWSFGDGITDPNVNATHTYTAANNYSVKLVETSADGCVDSTTQTVFVNASPATPIITAGGPVSFCGNGSVILSSNAATGNQWYKDGSIITGATNQTYTATVAATYTDIVSVGSCSSSPSEGITVTNTSNSPTPIITTISPLSFCKDGTAILNSSAAANNQWYQDGTIIPGATSQMYTATTAGIYTVIDNNNNCPSNPSNGITLSINPSPQVAFLPIPSVCENAMPVLLNEGADISGLPGTGTYSGDGVIANNTAPQTYSFSPQEAGAGLHTIHYSYRADNGCVSDTAQTVTVNTVPVVDFGGTKPILQGDSAQLSPKTFSANGLKYSWSPSLYLNNDTAMSPLCKPSNDIVYTITIRADSLCATTDMLTVKVLSNFDVPNTFTPNGDGINDTWIIDKLAVYPVHHVQVFNRYGQLIFESTNYKPWDGTYNGKPVPPGTYYYIIELGDSGNAKTGYVTILR